MLVHVMSLLQVVSFLSQIVKMYCYLIHLYCVLVLGPFYGACMDRQLTYKFSSANDLIFKLRIGQNRTL